MPGLRSGIVIGIQGINHCDGRLYANCHVVSWDATEREIQVMRTYLNDAFQAELQQALVSSQFSLALA